MSVPMGTVSCGAPGAALPRWDRLLICSAQAGSLLLWARPPVHCVAPSPITATAQEHPRACPSA